MKSLIGAVVLLACAVFTYQRSHVWQSRESIWAEAVKESPLLPRTHLNLGELYDDRHQFTLAIDQNNAAFDLSFDPRRMKRHQEMTRRSAQANVARILLEMGQFKASAELNTQILEQNPFDQTALINRAAARMALHDCPEAFLDYLKAGFSELPQCH